MSDRFPVVNAGDVHKWPELDGQETAVLPACEDKTATGHWVCAQHGESFPHNWAMDSHVHDNRRHAIAWWCYAHGPEVP